MLLFLFQFLKGFYRFLSQIMALFGWGNIPSITLASGFRIPISEREYEKILLWVKDCVCVW
jgi:hypothetical protein